MLHSATLTIADDEPAYLLTEMNMLTPNNREVHRYQTIKVIRGEAFAEWVTDMGTAAQYKGVPEFAIPGGVPETDGRFTILHDVAELRFIAGCLHDPDYAPHFLARDEGPPDLIVAYHEAMELTKKEKQHQSVSGPYLHIDR